MQDLKPTIWYTYSKWTKKRPVYNLLSDVLLLLLYRLISRAFTIVLTNAITRGDSLSTNLKLLIFFYEALTTSKYVFIIVNIILSLEENQTNFFHHITASLNLFISDSWLAYWDLWSNWLYLMDNIMLLIEYSRLRAYLINSV